MQCLAIVGKNISEISPISATDAVYGSFWRSSSSRQIWTNIWGLKSTTLLERWWILVSRWMDLFSRSTSSSFKILKIRSAYRGGIVLMLEVGPLVSEFWTSPPSREGIPVLNLTSNFSFVRYEVRSGPELENYVGRIYIAIQHRPTIGALPISYRRPA